MNLQKRKGKRKIEREITLPESISIMVLFIVMLVFCIAVWEIAPHIPLIMSTGLLIAFASLCLHISWDDLKTAMFDAVLSGLESMLVILFIGGTIGSWISSGTVAMIISYGLQLFSPQFFLVSVLLISAVMSILTGSSWATVGTVGIAFMGVAHGLGINPAIAAACVACGAFFGDKQSPVSDTTNFAAAVARTDLYAHVKSMLYTTGPAFVFTAIIFLIIGFQYKGAADVEIINEISNGLRIAFHFNPVLLLPLLIMIALIILKVPAFLVMIITTAIGIFNTVVFQGVNMPQAITYAYSGFVSETGSELIDTLLTRGGVASMYYTIGLMMFSFLMAGLLSRTGTLRTIVNKLSNLTKSRVGLVGTTVFTTVVFNFLAADPYLAMLLSGKAFEEKYDEKGLKRQVLSRSLEDGGTLICPMVPWGSSGVYVATTLGVATISYFPYYFIGFITPAFSILCALTGFGMFMDEEKRKKKEKLAMEE